MAVLGMAAGECAGGLSVANRVKLPMIGTSCVIQEIVGENCNPWFFNGDPSPLGLAEAMRVVLPQTVPGLIGSRWAVIGDDPGWSQSVADYWNDVPGAKPAGVEIAPFGTTDWGPYIAKLKASGAKALLMAISFGVQYPAFLQQANAAGLFEQMQPVAPLGFPENGQVPGYGERASEKTVDALKKVEVVWQYGAPWTYIEENSPEGKKYVEMFVKEYGGPPAAQANMQMNNTWRMLTAIKEVGTDPQKIAEKLATPITTPYYSEPQGVQKGNRQIDVPAFVTKLEELPKPQYGVEYANQVDRIIPAKEVIRDAKTYECNLPSF